jgi:hypothetical protein
MRDKTKHSLYQTWSNIIQRCENSNNPSFHNYGGRGIKICDRWKRSFSDFANDMGPRPFGMTIDRIDSNGNYEPSNCRWATKNEQARNTRKKRIIEIEGKQYHVAELSAMHGIDMKTLYWRASQGWPMEKVLSKDMQWNNTDSQQKAAAVHAEQKRAETHCKRGHEFTPENTYLYRTTRSCRICRRAWDKFLYYKRTRPIEDFL